jgi:hypothetical protein
MNERLLEARATIKTDAGPKGTSVGEAVNRQARAFHDLSEAVWVLGEEVAHLKEERLAAQRELGRVVEQFQNLQARLALRKTVGVKIPLWWVAVSALFSGLASAAVVLGLLIILRLG